MKTWKVEGMLNQGFQGHIEYQILLPKETKGVKILFEFDQREVADQFEAWNQKCVRALEENIVGEENTFESGTQIPYYTKLKSEINLSVYCQGVCLGCFHKDKTCKRIEISDENATEGFQPCVFAGGVMTISLHVYSILNEQTKYQLHVFYEDR